MSVPDIVAESMAWYLHIVVLCAEVIEIVWTPFLLWVLACDECLSCDSTSKVRSFFGHILVIFFP